LASKVLVIKRDLGALLRFCTQPDWLLVNAATARRTSNTTNQRRWLAARLLGDACTAEGLGMLRGKKIGRRLKATCDPEVEQNSSEVIFRITREAKGIRGTSLWPEPPLDPTSPVPQTGEWPPLQFQVCFWSLAVNASWLPGSVLKHFHPVPRR
jgi:hypothetical protein